MEEPNKVLVEWLAMKELMKDVELDVVKNSAKGVAAAGVRLRKGLRSMRRKIDFVIKATIEQDKINKAARVPHPNRGLGLRNRKS